MASTSFRNTEPHSSQELPARLELFGFPSSDATVRVRPRPASWRGTRAAFFALAGLILAPLVGLVPPHAPWVLGALGIGGFLAVRRWKERYTILELKGACPKCGEDLCLDGGGPLKPEISISCAGCNHDSRLLVSPPADSAEES